MRCRTLHRCVDWNPGSVTAPSFVGKSHPSRVRGLKCQADWLAGYDYRVAPFTGVWSEIPIYFDEADFIYKGNKGRLKYLVVKELLPFQIFKSSNPILHSVPHRQPGWCGLFLYGNRVRRPVSRPGRRGMRILFTLQMLRMTPAVSDILKMSWETNS